MRDRAKQQAGPGRKSAPPVPRAQFAGEFRTRGFLPEADPLTAFPAGSELAMLDELGRDLPSLLQDPGFRRYCTELALPVWPAHRNRAADLPELRLYYLRVGFLASAYINQLGVERATVLPRNIAVPFAQACARLQRPPILSYDGYALYNWKRFRRDGPITLGNLDTLQNFVHLYDEHWFILVHVEIEAIAARILDAIAQLHDALPAVDSGTLDAAFTNIAIAVREQVQVLRRIPEKMDPALYHKTFRPYIRFFDNVRYEGVEQAPLYYRGETGAQSSVIPALVACMKIPHRTSVLTEHLADLRNYMPAAHRDLLSSIAAMPDLRPQADKHAYNEVLKAMAEFREVHYGWAREYIERWTDDPRGTGGTPYMQWLKQLIDETRAAMIT